MVLNCYLCTSLSCAFPLQLYIVLITFYKDWGKDFTYQHLLIYFFFLSYSQFYSFIILHNVSILFNPASLQWQYIYLGSFTAIWKGFIYLFIFMFIPCTFQISVNVHGNSCYNTLHSRVLGELHNPMWFAVYTPSNHRFVRPIAVGLFPFRNCHWCHLCVLFCLRFTSRVVDEKSVHQFFIHT